MYAIKTPPAQVFGREAYYLVAGLMNYPFHFKFYVRGALFEGIIGITPYLSCFEVEGKLLTKNFHFSLDSYPRACVNFALEKLLAKQIVRL